MCTAVLYLILGLFYGVSFGDILWTSVALTLAAYLIGDLIVLPAFGNLVATIADLGLAYFGIWIIGGMLYEEPIPLVSAAFLTAAVIAGGEWFFHRYMKNRVLAHDRY